MERLRDSSWQFVSVVISLASLLITILNSSNLNATKYIIEVGSTFFLIISISAIIVIPGRRQAAPQQNAGIAPPPPENPPPHHINNPTPPVFERSTRNSPYPPTPILPPPPPVQSITPLAQGVAHRSPPVKQRQRLSTTKKALLIPALASLVVYIPAVFMISYGNQDNTVLIVGSILELIGYMWWFASWIHALIVAGRLNRWGWFTLVFLTSWFGTLIYIFFGPETPRKPSPKLQVKPQ